jgi:DNA-binding CsgD family transcriptional regulator/tetratricopeptide (TPR) repeat protein
LSTEEQDLFQQLSVFSGGWTLDAAEAVCEPAAQVVALLPSLVDKSLVQVEREAAQSRYRLLETLRQYAADKLRESRAEAAARSRHLRWCERLARAGDPGLSGPAHWEWLRRLEAEVDNFRAALGFSMLEPDELEAGLRLAASLVRFWFLDGGTAEGSEWLEALLAHAPQSAGRVEALSASGFLLVRRGNPRTARPLLEEAVALARRIGDNSLLAVPLNHLGELLIQEGDLAGARAALEESLASNTDEAGRAVFWPSYVGLYNLGEVATMEGDAAAAAAYYQRSAELAQARQDGFRHVPLRLLGQVAIDQGHLDAAHEFLTASLIAAREWGKAGWGVAPVLAHLANLAMAEGQPARALCLAGAAVGLRERRQAKLQSTDTVRLEVWMESARSTLGEEVSSAAWAAGYAMTLEQAANYALEAPSNYVETSPAARLTPREMEITRLLARHATNRDIAAQLVISESTAKRHVENILLKLGFRSRAQIAEWASKREVLKANSI